MGKSWILLCLILFSTRLAARMRSKREENIIKVDSSECEVSGVVMTCDYKGLNEEPLYIEPLQNTQIQMLFLSNIKDLYLEECVPVNLSVTNIQRISIKPSGDFHCEKFELSAKYSNLNEIPKSVSQLYLEECNVEMIQPKLSLSKLLVISSKVEQLDVTIPLVNGTVAVMHSSRITLLKNFAVDSGSTLLIKETTIDSVHPDAIDLRDGKIVIENSILNKAGASKNDVLLGGVTYQIEGTLTLTPFNRTEVFDSLEQVSYFNLFCVFLVLFFVSSIAFCAYISRRESRSRKSKKETNLEKEHYSPLPAEEDKVTDCDKRNSATERDLKERIKEIIKQFENIHSSFEEDKRCHLNKIEELNKTIGNTEGIDTSRAKKQKDEIKEYFRYMDELQNTKNRSLTLFGRIDFEAYEESRSNSEKKDSLSIAEENQLTKLLDTFVNCESQVNQTLSCLKGPKPEKKPSTPEETMLLKNIPLYLRDDYKKFWKSIKNKKNINDIFKYTDAEVSDAIFNFQISTLKILVGIQEIDISNMRKYFSTT